MQTKNYCKLWLGLAICSLSLNCSQNKDQHMEAICSDTWNVIKQKQFLQWEGLPGSCTYSHFESAFPRLDDASGRGYLGRQNTAASFRMYEVNGYDQPLRAWFREDSLLLIEAFFPNLNIHSEEIVRQFGEPDRKLNYQVDVLAIPKGAWIFPDKGLSIFLDAGYRKIVQIALFHPCDSSVYLEQLNPEEDFIEWPDDGTENE